MAYSQQLDLLTRQAGNSGGGNALKFSALLGIASGIASAGLYYLYTRQKGQVEGAGDQMSLLKQELIREMRQKSIHAPKDEDYTMPRDFMIYLFRLLYTYQTIGKEILKEQVHE